MLLLTRKVNQQIIVGGAIRITILDARGDVARIGVEAPEGTAIRRGDEPPPRPDRPGVGIAGDA
jgi:carbon storage regulator CsrA